MAVTRREFIGGSAAGAAGLVVGGVLGKVVTDGGDGSGGGALSGNVGSIAEARGLAPDEELQAVKTFHPPGRPEMDEFYIISSGGHSGELLVMGVPSMKI